MCRFVLCKSVWQYAHHVLRENPRTSDGTSEAGRSASHLRCRAACKQGMHGVGLVLYLEDRIKIQLYSCRKTKKLRDLCARAVPARLAAHAGSAHRHPRGRDRRPGGARQRATRRVLIDPWHSTRPACWGLRVVYLEYILVVSTTVHPYG